MDMSTASGWENLAEGWDASEEDEGSNWHRMLLHPALLTVLGPVAGQRVLDRFVVLALEEPAPTPEFTRGEADDAWPDTPFLEQLPLHCIIEARQMTGG
jgi:hypothetical protein